MKIESDNNISTNNNMTAQPSENNMTTPEANPHVASAPEVDAAPSQEVITVYTAVKKPAPVRTTGAPPEFGADKPPSEYVEVPQILKDWRPGMPLPVGFAFITNLWYKPGDTRTGDKPKKFGYACFDFRKKNDRLFIQCMGVGFSLRDVSGFMENKVFSVDEKQIPTSGSHPLQAFKDMGLNIMPVWALSAHNRDLYLAVMNAIRHDQLPHNLGALQNIFRKMTPNWVQGRPFQGHNPNGNGNFERRPVNTNAISAFEMAMLDKVKPDETKLSEESTAVSVCEQHIEKIAEYIHPGEDSPLPPLTAEAKKLAQQYLSDWYELKRRYGQTFGGKRVTVR